MRKGASADADHLGLLRHHHLDRVFLEFGAPTWPNGFDLAPEWLRREMAAAGELRRSAAA